MLHLIPRHCLKKLPPPSPTERRCKLARYVRTLDYGSSISVAFSTATLVEQSNKSILQSIATLNEANIKIII